MRTYALESSDVLCVSLPGPQRSKLLTTFASIVRLASVKVRCGTSQPCPLPKSCTRTTSLLFLTLACLRDVSSQVGMTRWRQTPSRTAPPSSLARRAGCGERRWRFAAGWGGTGLRRTPSLTAPPSALARRSGRAYYLLLSRREGWRGGGGVTKLAHRAVPHQARAWTQQQQQEEEAAEVEVV